MVREAQASQQRTRVQLAEQVLGLAQYLATIDAPASSCRVRHRDNSCLHLATSRARHRTSRTAADARRSTTLCMPRTVASCGRLVVRVGAVVVAVAARIRGDWHGTRSVLYRA